MNKLLIFLALMLPLSAYGGCLSIAEAQAILNRTIKTVLKVKQISPVDSFNACKIETEEGETFFLSGDGRYLIEGVLVKVPPLTLSPDEVEKLKKDVLFYVGNGKEVLVVTNPLCSVCRKNRTLLKSLSRSFRFGFVPAGFSKEEELAAIDAVCRKKSQDNFFETPAEPKLCDRGKLKVWEVSDLLKRHGITGTPVFVFPNGKVAVGIDEFFEVAK